MQRCNNSVGLAGCYAHSEPAANRCNDGANG
jgi:hypothetical protein